MLFAEDATVTRRVILVLAAVLTLSTTLVSCGTGTLGYGVVLISPDTQALQTGAVVKVIEESGINATYSVESSDSGEQYELDKWRIEIFDDQEAAREWADSYEEYVPLYARNLRDGLAVREEADINSNRVYKLRLDQEIKILRRTEVSEQIGSRQGYWYKVLTTDGVQGYCFDYYLDIYDITAEAEMPEGPDLSILNAALEKVYRPEAFKGMIESGQIFLDRFTKEYGLFTDLEQKRIRVVLFEKSYVFDFDEVRRTADSRYRLFPADLEIILRSKERIQLVFTIEDKTYDPVFVTIDEETIDEVRTAEIERRTELLTGLIENGPLYISSAYGSIRFLEDGGFSWERLDRLVPSIIPNSDFSGGTVSFDHFISREISTSYDGVLALRFRQSPDRPIILLYTLDGSSLKLEYVPERNVDERIIQQRSSSPLIMAFFGQQ